MLDRTKSGYYTYVCVWLVAFYSDFFEDYPVELSKPLPARQMDVLRFIVSLSEEHSYPPTLAELATALGLKNRMTVHQHLAALKKKGYVHWEPGLNRSLRVLPEALSLLGLGYEEENEEPVKPAKLSLVDGGARSSAPTGRADNLFSGIPFSGIPLAGAIAAGNPIDAISTDEFLEVESRYGGSCYALKVKGESMIEDGIFDGDFVIVKPNPSPLNGDVVVALLEDGSATLKRFFKEKSGYRLQPANSSMEPIYVPADAPPMVQGTVVGLFRKMQ